MPRALRDNAHSNLPYIQALVREVGLEALAAMEVEAVRTRPIPRRLADALADEEPRKRVLTQREIEIVGLVAEGLTKQEIAEELYVSIETVKSHLRHVNAKLDVHNPAQMVVRAIQAGYLQVG